MQQTEKYQFHLIEGSDDFSPQPLNDNMEKVEEQFQSMETELAGELDQVMANLGTIGHNLRIETGSYLGTGLRGATNPTGITTQLYPILVAVVCSGSAATGIPPALFLRPAQKTIWVAGDMGSRALNITWSDHAVEWYVHDAYGSEYQANQTGQTYHYVVLGY